MEPESPSPYPQMPATCPYPEPTPSSPHDLLPASWRSILILSSHLRLGLPNGVFPPGFPTNNLLQERGEPVLAIRISWISRQWVLIFEQSHFLRFHNAVNSERTCIYFEKLFKNDVLRPL